MSDSEDRSITDSILLGNTIGESLEEAESELEGLPFNHPARMSHYLDQEIVNEASGFGVNHDVVKAVGLIREVEADRDQRRKTIAEGNQAVQDDYDAALRRFIATRGAS